MIPTPYKRTPIEFKQYEPKKMVRHTAPVPEALEKHRDLRQQVLDLMDRMSMPNFSKEIIKDKLWGIYLQLK